MEEKMNFLIVDDEPLICWALEIYLGKLGFLCKKARNGGEALALVGRMDFPLAFVDAKLPDIDGLELARQIRQGDSARRIFLVSGYFYKDDEVVQKALEEGIINGFIAKPFFHDEILLAIQGAVAPLPPGA